MIVKLSCVLSLLATLSALSFTHAAQAEGNADHGQTIFKRCSACHMVEDTKNRVGPHLMNIIGRAAGAVEGYRYSKAMSKVAGDGLVWDEETLKAYLTAPRSFLPGTTMAYAGLKKPDDLDDLIAYLRSKTQP